MYIHVDACTAVYIYTGRLYDGGTALCSEVVTRKTPRHILWAVVISNFMYVVTTHMHDDTN